mmetsp:Transcript_19142/g.46215  ORF Transcript_19142/g.46215 Transcript_19142/m.46215 type:complete len:204 (+) Transcript_19142:315-926(+)
MFTLVQMRDAVPIPASELDKPRPTAVGNVIELKYCNRILPGVGLCICLYDITQLGDGKIYLSDSRVHVRAEFQLLVFRPFIGEVLTGKIARSSPEGLWLTVGFFDNIFVPPHFMLDGSEWDPSQNLWVWKSEHGEAALDPRFDSPVRFRVTNSIFKKEERPLEAPPAAHADVGARVHDPNAPPPYQVMASIKDDGLGLVIWWE